MLFFFFFFKQKTAYEMRISDWSSDVCSSDLCPLPCRPSTPAWLHPAADPGGPGVALSSAVARPVRYLRHQLMWPPRKAPRPIWHCAWLYRSEEHTSELQSLMRISYAVFCLKKKTKKNTQERNKYNSKYNMTDT